MRNIVRLILSLVCSIVLGSNLIPVTAVASNQDITAPVIESIEMLTKDVKPKEQVQVNIKVTDDLSGVEHISVEFSSPSYTHRVNGFASIAKATENDTYTVKTNAINEFAEPGTWHITRITVSDKSGNATSKNYGYEYYYEETPPVKFDFQNEHADTKAPVIESIEMLTKDVKPKEQVQVNIKVTDDLSGVEHISVEFSSPSNTHRVNGFASIAKATEDDTYTVKTNAINEFAEPGTWHITRITVSDKSGNATSKNYGYEYHYGEIPPVTFIVGNISDVIPVEPNPEDTEFQVWESEFNIDKNKKWTVTFALPFDPKTIYEGNNIYVANSKGNIMNTSFIIDNTSETGTQINASSVTILAPREGYGAGETYTLYIKNVKGKNGEKLKQFTKMNFTIKAENNSVIEIN